MGQGKRCVYCQRMFDPHPQTAFHQIACDRVACQVQRRRDTQKVYRQEHGDDEDYSWDSKKAWARKHGRDYMRKYREDNKTYVRENRRQQKERNKKRGMIVKKDVWKQLYRGKLVRFRILESDCKERLVRLV